MKQLGVSPMLEWQPIETAPEGTCVLVIDFYEPHVAYRTDEGQWTTQHGTFLYDVTHWRPLPPLPEAADAGASGETAVDGNIEWDTDGRSFTWRACDGDFKRDPDGRGYTWHARERRGKDK